MCTSSQEIPDILAGVFHGGIHYFHFPQENSSDTVLTQASGQARVGNNPVATAGTTAATLAPRHARIRRPNYFALNLTGGILLIAVDADFRR